MTSYSKGVDKKVLLIPLKRGIPHPSIYMSDRKQVSTILCKETQMINKRLKC